MRSAASSPASSPALFESVGIAVEDLAAAALVYRLAEEQNLGTLARW